MTLPVQTPIDRYTYSGSPTFVYSFLLLNAGDLLVTVDGVPKTLNADYTVSGVGSLSGGTITYTSELILGQAIALAREIALQRLTDYQDEGDLLAGDLNADFDRLWMALQDDVSVQTTRTLRAPLGEVFDDLPVASLRANTQLVFGSQGLPAVLPLSPTTPVYPALGISIDAVGGNGNDSFDNTTAINAAIASLASLGGGKVLFSAGKVYRYTGAIVLASGVMLELNGATLKHVGSNSIAMSNATSGVIVQGGIRGGTIDLRGSTAQFGLVTFSAYSCLFDELLFLTNSAFLTVISIETNGAGGLNPNGNRNAAYNEFSNITQDGGPCQTFIRLKGDFPGNASVVTLNTFTNCNSNDARVVGINFLQWCDNNYFAGMTRLNMLANSAIGVLWNGSGTPTLSVGVYANNFDHLAVDTFGVMTGRVGIKMNNTKDNVIGLYFNVPAAEGGAMLFDASCQSYNLLAEVGGSGQLIRHALNYSHGGKENPKFLVGGTGDISTETCSVILGFGRTGNGFSTVDLIGDGISFPTFGLRILRNGAGGSQLLHRGTAALELKAQDTGGTVVLSTVSGPQLTVGDGTQGFYGHAAVAKPTVTGSRGGNVALASLLTALAGMGLLIDSSS